MEWLATFLIVAPALYLYVIRSNRLIDYLVWITVLNRGLRRYVDWLNGSFNPLSPISLTPLVVAGLIFLMVFQDYGRLPGYFKRICSSFIIALFFAFAVGIIRNKFAAIYSLAEYVTPLSIMACAVLAWGREDVQDRWIKTVGYAAMAASAYGWYQYFTIPPWDAFWVRAVGFEGYLGQLRPTEMTVFSTMAERGPLASFLGFAVIPMICSKRWRNIGGWFSVLLILSVILLTLVRSTIITIGLATILYPILNQGKNTMRLILLLCVVALAANVGLSRLPTSEKISARVGTIANITEDGSFKGRVAIAQHGVSGVLRNPLGTGLGSTGLAGRVNTGEVEAGGEIGDNGYFAIMFTFGWIGSIFFFRGFYLLWKQIRIFEKLGIRTDALMLFKALFVTGSIALIAGDWISGAGSIVFFILAGFAVHPRPAMDRYAHSLASRRKAEGDMPTLSPAS